MFLDEESGCRWVLVVGGSQSVMLTGICKFDGFAFVLIVYFWFCEIL